MMDKVMKHVHVNMFPFVPVEQNIKIHVMMTLEWG